MHTLPKNTTIIIVITMASTTRLRSATPNQIKFLVATPSEPRSAKYGIYFGDDYTGQTTNPTNSVKALKD